ncbi:MAG TPA: branched-chain amino acid ABC transporter permease [Longimicrobiales bacterium]|nr:branched-chain amino acid ABC transporter permease [Longimicrobiales bacterium]
MSGSLASRLVPTALLVVAIVFPLAVDNPYLVSVVVTAYVIAIAVYGLDVLLGYTGQLSLAHAGFFGIGGYTVGVLTADHGFSFWTALPVALALTVALAHLIGLAALRTRHDYFAIFTLAVGVMIVIVIDRWAEVTGGTDGLIGIPPPPAIGPLQFDTLTGQYYLALAFLLLTIYVVWALVHSLVGRTFLAVRNSEDLARAVGIDAGRTHQLSFVISAALAGLGGSLYAVFLGYIGPAMGNVQMTFMMLVYLMIGGVASLAGPLVGTLLVMGLMQALQAFNEYQMMVLGPILVVVIIFFPHGLAGQGRRLVERLTGGRAGDATAP